MGFQSKGMDDVDAGRDRATASIRHDEDKPLTPCFSVGGVRRKSLFKASMNEVDAEGGGRRRGRRRTCTLRVEFQYTRETLRASV
jgi:hypothetical protein